MTDSPRFPSKKLEVEKYHKNVAQEVVEITTDRLRIILSEHYKCVDKEKDWQVAGGIFLALIASLVTADFKNILGVEGGVWKSMFILGTLISGVWLFVSLLRLLNRKSIDDLIRKITNQE